MAKSPARVYLKELHDAWEYWGTWLPGRRVRVGDCGPLDGVVFDRQENLGADYGIRVAQEPSDQRWPTLQHKSRWGVSIKPSVRASVPGLGHEELTVKFRRANGVVFAAKSVREDSMVARGAVARQLGDLVRDGRFPPEYVIVTDVLVAASLTVLMSRSSGESLKVTMSAPVTTPIGPASLAAALEATGTGATNVKIVGKRRMTPMFKLMRAPRLAPVGFLPNVQDYWRKHVVSLFHGANPTRLAHIKLADELSASVPLGQPIVVQPNASQEIAIGSLNGELLNFETQRWGPLTIEPIVVSGVREWLGEAVDYKPEVSAALTAATAEPVDWDYARTGEITLRLFDNVPLIFEQPSGELMLARPISPVSVEVAESDRELVPSEPTAPVEYVDFDAVYAATDPVAHRLT